MDPEGGARRLPTGGSPTGCAHTTATVNSEKIHRVHPRQEAMLRVSRYQWWPHMHKDIVTLAGEYRSCNRKNPKNASKSLPLLTQPGQELQLDYTGPIENLNGKKSTCM